MKRYEIMSNVRKEEALNIISQLDGYNETEGTCGSRRFENEDLGIYLEVSTPPGTFDYDAYKEKHPNPKIDDYPNVHIYGDVLYSRFEEAESFQGVVRDEMKEICELLHMRQTDFYETYRFESGMVKSISPIKE